MRKVFFVLSVVLIMTALVGLSFAQQSKPALDRQDSNFIKDAALDNQMEIQLGQLAARQGSSQEVKNFGQRMVNDHTKANQELMSIAQQKGISVPTTLDRDRQKKIDDLGKKSGADFDRAYMSDMAKNHRNDINKFEKEAKDGKDADLKSFASKTLPTLRQHEGMVAQIQPQVAKK